VPNYCYKFTSKSKIVLIILLQLFLVESIYGQISFDPQPSFFRNQRQMPLVSLATTQDFNVATYGAIKNDGLNDLVAIQAAIDAAEAAASTSRSVRVVFDQGTYDIMPTTDANHALFVTNDTNILFEGNDSEIRNHNPQIGFFEVRSCTNVIFKNFSFDYAVLPFTQGKVTSVNTSNNTFAIYIENGFPAITETRFSTAPETWGVIKDATGKLKSGVKNLFPYIGWTTTTFANTYRINAPSSYLANVAVGDYYVHIARHNGKTIFNTVRSKNVTYLNITIYSSPAGSFNGQENYETNFINCNVIPKPGSGRVQSGNADVIHITGNYFGPWVQGCRFEAITDDAVNLKHAKRDIMEVVSPTVLKVKFLVTTSDKLVIFNPRTGTSLATDVTVTNVVNEGNNIFRITLNKNHNVTVVGEHQTGDKAYMTNRASESAVFRNNTFKNGRRYGMLLQSSYTEVKNCTFENLSSSGIKMENGVDWGEGYIANNIEINGNTFINCGFDSSYIDDPNGAAINTVVSKLKKDNCSVADTWCGTEPVAFQGFQNINIKNNSFLYNKTGINLQNINGGTITGNTFVHNAPDATLKFGETPNTILSSNNSNLTFDAMGNLSFEEYKIKLNRNGDLLSIIDEGNEDSGFTITLFDSSGKKLQTKTSDSNIAVFDVSNYQKGMYIITIENKQFKTFKKVML
jgi:Secretion system C-terminal sorting domain